MLLGRTLKDQKSSFMMDQFHHWINFSMGRYWMISEKESD